MAIGAMVDCSTLESVVVGFTSVGRGSRTDRAILLNARKRRCRVHDGGAGDLDLRRGCSTLESVVVGFTLVSIVRESYWDHCSTLESVVVGFTPYGQSNESYDRGLLNARKRRCRVHPAPESGPQPEAIAAQRSKASLSGSPEDPSDRSCPPKLLNARKRRCRVHHAFRRVAPRPHACSTLESVVVGFTGLLLRRSGRRPLLNARKRRCRVHRVRGAIVGHLERLLNARKRRCRVHLAPMLRRSRQTSAQRSKASLSGSPARSSPSLRRRPLLNARKRRCRVHDGQAAMNSGIVFCSTLESVVVGFTPRLTLLLAQESICSTLESVVVGFTAGGGVVRPPRRLLNARKRRCRVHPVGG